MAKENYLFNTSMDMYIKIMELARLKGKKPGESIQEEFNEIMRANPDKFTLLGKTEADLDMLTGELRDRGLKVLNPKEKERRDNNEI
ncbi:MAG: hypothetical protein M0R03_08675 [Novosphingobium sp.]|nr:hypothetical protein [Novosphingobium sp.]